MQNKTKVQRLLLISKVIIVLSILLILGWLASRSTSSYTWDYLLEEMNTEIHATAPDAVLFGVTVNLHKEWVLFVRHQYSFRYIQPNGNILTIRMDDVYNKSRWRLDIGNEFMPALTHSELSVVTESAENLVIGPIESYNIARPLLEQFASSRNRSCQVVIILDQGQEIIKSHGIPAIWRVGCFIDRDIAVVYVNPVNGSIVDRYFP